MSSYLDEDLFDADDWADDGFGDVLAEVLSEDYADADLDDLDEAAEAMLGALSPAEAFGATQALRQMGRGAGSVASDRTFGQVASTLLPTATAALGTAVAGPAGGRRQAGCGRERHPDLHRRGDGQREADR